MEVWHWALLIGLGVVAWMADRRMQGKFRREERAKRGHRWWQFWRI